jgi:hypothetical protein
LVKLDRRTLLKAAGLVPLAALAPRAGATDYASAGDVLDAIDGLEADVASRLRRLASAVPRARAMAASFLADHERHRGERERLRRRLRLAPAAPLGERASPEASLASLRGQQEALLYAHAEGMPALGAALAVDALSQHLIDLSRQLTVLDLWLDAEADRG